MTTAANDNRPPEFDNAVAAYLPGMHAQAGHYCRQVADREDLVNDTVEYALRTWRDFRPDGAMWWWLKWRMRKVVAERAIQAKAAKRVGRAVSMAAASGVHVPANQNDAAALSQVLAGMPTRTRDIMLRSAMGEEGPEIGARHGIGRERVRQIIRKERARLAGVAA